MQSDLDLFCYFVQPRVTGDQLCQTFAVAAELEADHKIPRASFRNFVIFSKLCLVSLERDREGR